jgi:hypothetical protein
LQTCDSLGQWPAAQACPAAPNAQATCSAGACAFQCNQGYGDCDGVAGNGCEIDVLKDDDNCGSCGRSCIGSYCIGTGQCEPAILTNLSAVPKGIAVDDAYVYWTVSGNVQRIGKDGGGSPTTLYTGSATWVDVSDTDVYFVEVGGAIKRMPKAGGAVTIMAPSTANMKAIDLDPIEGSVVYGAGSYPNGTLVKVTKTGFKTTLTTNPEPPTSVTANCGIAWATYSSSGSVISWFGTVATGQSYPSGVAANCVDVFWVTSNTVMQTGPTQFAATPDG